MVLGKFVSRIGGGKLLGPKGIAVNSAGNLIVVDNKASCVYVFQLNGKLLSKFGARGSEAHNLAGPHYVAVNSLGHIIISDFHNHSIKVREIVLGGYVPVYFAHYMVFTCVFTSHIL